MNRKKHLVQNSCFCNTVLQTQTFPFTPPKETDQFYLRQRQRKFWSLQIPNAWMATPYWLDSRHPESVSKMWLLPPTRMHAPTQSNTLKEKWTELHKFVCQRMEDPLCFFASENCKLAVQSWARSWEIGFLISDWLKNQERKPRSPLVSCAIYLFSKICVNQKTKEKAMQKHSFFVSNVHFIPRACGPKCTSLSRTPVPFSDLLVRLHSLAQISS